MKRSILNFLDLKPNEFILLGIMIIAVIFGYIIYFSYGGEAFAEGYAREDGIVESGTALALLLTGLFHLKRAIKLRGGSTLRPLLGGLFIGLLFLFGAGEEISWGQRIFGFGTPETLQHLNKQDEFNLHNLDIGGVSINKLIFSQLFSIVLIVYFFVVPWLYKSIHWIQQLIDSWHLPVPRMSQSLSFLILSLLIIGIPSDKKWELLEFVFAVTFLMVSIHPLNKHS